MSEIALSRRSLLKSAGILGLTAAVGLDGLALMPDRTAAAAAPTGHPRFRYPDIQYDIGDYIGPVVTLGGVAYHFAPVYTSFTTFALSRTPHPADQAALAAALATLESAYPYSPAGVFAMIGYGLPYFSRVGTARIPRLLADRSRLALEEAVPSPTDVSPLNPNIVKQTYQVSVTIESNDVLLVMRSDNVAVLADCLAYLTGTDTLAGASVPPAGLNRLLTPTSSRLMFTQVGLPRKLADAEGLPYASRINPDSPMWQSTADQHVSGAGPAQICTFAGSPSARTTTARSGDYFDNASIMHLSHVIQDLPQFYANDEPFTERCQYMFRSNPIPSLGYSDQFTDGGGTAYIENTFQGANDALRNAMAINTFNGEHRMGHVSALQRSSRAHDGTPMHIRADGPGFDAMDVPNGSKQPKLQFCIFVPTADFFTKMRVNQASLDLVKHFGVADEDNGLERFITTTRRQMFLCPPRRHRSFPLVEFR